MAIVKMKRLRLLGMRSDREQLLRLVQRLGCVEVNEPAIDLSDPEWAALAKPDGKGLSLAREQSGRISQALAVLRKRANAKDGLFRKRPGLREGELFDDAAYLAGLDVASAILEEEKQYAALHTERSKLMVQQAALNAWASLDVPLETEGDENLSVIFGTIPAKADYEAMAEGVLQAAEMVSLNYAGVDRELHYFLLICHPSVEGLCTDAMRPFGFSRASVKGWTGTAAENIRVIGGQLTELDEKIGQTLERILSFAPERERLCRCADRASQEIAREEAKSHLLDTAQVFFMEGWMPANKEEELNAVLTPFSCAVYLTEPEDGDRVPTLLENPRWMRCINMVTEMYSLPAYDGIDPNPLIFFTYVFFFGFMFADVAYGLIILAISLAVTKLYRPKGTMGHMFQLGQWLGGSTALCGIFVGGFFGNALEVIYDTFLQTDMPGWMETFSSGIVVNPVTDPMTVLIIAMVIGAIQLVFGQLVHIYMGVRDHQLLDALLDVVPWWIVFAGIGVIALAGNPWVLVLGFLALLLTQGRHKEGGIFSKLFGGIASWYDITSWLSDILSYARLMALMLATSVIAQVFNTLGALGGRTVVGVIMFVIVFLIGHVFNIGVNLIGTYVHAARLHYLEFFGKFYKEGGIPFRPLQYSTKYVDIINEEET